jgi:type IX secretion system PorP/SprF family membrane protein
MKRLFTKVVVMIAGISGVAMAQQDPQFTQFMHSKLIYNAGYAGTSDALCANILYRKQWVKFDGAPTTALLSFDMPILPMLGVGLNVMTDEIGPLKTTYVRLAASYNKTIGAGKLGIGIDGGLLQLATSNNWIVPEPGKTDPSIPGTYQSNSNLIINNANLNKASYDVSFGAFYNIPNNMYVGLSSSHLPSQSLTVNSGIKFTMARHYYLVAGKAFKLNPENVITPNVKIKSDAATTQVDINLTWTLRNMVWFGATYRLQDAIAPMFGVKLLKDKNLRVGYSYDYTLSKIKGYSTGTHEIMVGYCMDINKPKPQTVYGNVRFLD